MNSSMLITSEPTQNSAIKTNTVKPLLSNNDTDIIVGSMDSLMVGFNKLFVKMRDLQREYAQNSIQNALQLQNKAYQNEKHSVADSAEGSRVSMGTSISAALLGALGGATKMYTANAGAGIKSKLSKVDDMLKSGKHTNPEEALKAINAAEAEKTGIWKSIKNRMGRSQNNTMDELRDNDAYYSGWRGNAGDVLGTLNPIIDKAGQMGASQYTNSSQSEKVAADNQKELQHIDDKQFNQFDDYVRETSRQLRDITKEMNEIYSKIATAVHF